jgi:hypothetical protein
MRSVKMKTHMKVICSTLILAAIVVPFALNATMAAPVGSWSLMQTSEPQADQQQSNELGARAKLLEWLINHSTPAEVNGEAIALVKHILIIQVGKNQVRVLMSPGWIVDGKAIRAGKLFNGTYMSLSDDITVKALKTVLKTDNEGFSIYTLIGYEIIDKTSGAHAYAILPFNIETNGE